MNHPPIVERDVAVSLREMDEEALSVIRAMCGRIIAVAR